MDPYPTTLAVGFFLTTLAVVVLFLRSTTDRRITCLVIGTIAIIQGILASTGFYTDIDTLPPRLIFLLAPSFLIVAVLFFTSPGLRFLDRLNLKALTLLHLVRVPVELVLLGLYMHGSIPEIMTFEGRNFDIIPGLTAPVVYYLVFIHRSVGRLGLLLWNIISLAFLLNIVFHGILSTPYAFQQFAFDQPNIALMYFPFNWLPSIVVPLVLLAHLAAIRVLVRKPLPVAAMV